MVSRSTTDIGKAAVQVGNPREEPGIMLPKKVLGKVGKENGTQAKVEHIGSMESPRRVVSRTVEHGKQYPRTLGHPSFSSWKTRHLDWKYRTVLVHLVRRIQNRRSLWRLLMTFRRYLVRSIAKKNCTQRWKIQHTDTEAEE